MSRRRLTEEETKEIAQKDWKVKTIFSSDEALVNRAKNLTGPRTPEGKMKSLQNLRVGRNKGESVTMSHGGYIRRILDQDEQDMYEELRETYVKDYDLNNSADEVVLNLVLIDQIMLYRVLRKQFEQPSLDIERPLSEIGSRLTKNLSALGALRTQRLKQDERLTSISIASISQQFAREIMGGMLQADIEAADEEEKRFLEEKKQRDMAKTIDVEYEIVEQDLEENGD